LIFQVRKEAISAVKKNNGDINDELQVKGEYLVQFGKFRGQSFKWLLENSLGYVAWFIDNLRTEQQNRKQPLTAPIALNKAAFKEYAENFKEVCDQADKKKARREAEEAKHQATSVTKSSAKTTASPPAVSLPSRCMMTARYLAKITKPADRKFKPNIHPPRTASRMLPKRQPHALKVKQRVKVLMKSIVPWKNNREKFRYL